MDLFFVFRNIIYIPNDYCSQEGVDLSAAEVMASSAAEIIQSAGGQIQVIQATPEQVAQLQQAHQIQILQGDATQVIGVKLFKFKLFLLGFVVKLLDFVGNKYFVIRVLNKSASAKVRELTSGKTKKQLCLNKMPEL